MPKRLIALFVLLASGTGVLPPVDASTRDAPSESRFSVLVFSKTDGPHHASIDAGNTMLRRLGTAHDFQVRVTDDTSTFTADRLAEYDAVVFLNTVGDILTEGQQRAFRTYVEAGGGFVGIHAAAATEPEWTWYETLVGTRTEAHPGDSTAQRAIVHVSDPAHPATAPLPTAWPRTDVWQEYRPTPRGEVHVLATVDESTYDGGTMGPDHPIAWAHELEGGRAFYTGLGHAPEQYTDSLFVRHLLGGLEWAAGAADGDVGATVAQSFDKVVLDSTTTDPIELDVAPDGRVFYGERRGIIKIWDPETESSSVAGHLPVTIVNEDGLMGLLLDPRFAENGRLYLYYSPPTGPPRNQLSRFPVEGDSVRLESETKILTVPTQRDECCHTGGSMAFGPDGETLYLSTGDNTNPFASSGFSPIDERPGREPWDAQRTAANTQDLRGKILRVKPQPDGGYTIPEGNLFGPSDNGRPEIYVMGSRNPYRISVDSETGWLYWGDVGPDAGAADSARGPAGHDEFNQAHGPGNYGWPYFVGDNKAYHDYDFAADTAGAPFDPSTPVNDSPNNGGARVLPPAQPPMIWYPYGPSEDFPEMGAGGRTAMVGPVYHYDAESVGAHGLPASLDGSLLIYEWARNWVKEVIFDANGQPVAIHPLFPEKTFRRPMDMALGPNDRLYLIEWGDNFGGGPNSKIARLDYYGSPDRPPVANATASADSGPVPMTVTFHADTTHARTRDGSTYAWDFADDGATDETGPVATHTFDQPGWHTVRLTVTDNTGLSATDTVSVLAGNTRPTVTIDWPVEGGVAPFDTRIPYRVTVSDPEDERIADERIVVRSSLGRDSHTRPLQRTTGRAGTVRLRRTGHYAPKTALFGVLEAQYVDGGSPSAPPATGRARVKLHPRTMQAEYATTTEGLQEESFGDERPVDRRRALAADSGAYAAYGPVNLKNIHALTFNVAAESHGRIEVRRGSPEGPLLGTVKVPAASAPNAPTAVAADSTRSTDEDRPPLGAAEEDWREMQLPITDPGGPTLLYVVFHGRENDIEIKLDWIRFDGPGMARARSAPDE